MTETPVLLRGVSKSRLVASSLLPPEDPSGGTVHRTIRDWLVDSVAVLLAAALGLFAFADSVHGTTRHVSGIEILLDLALGLLGCVALWWRRRRPVELGIVTAAASIISGAVGGAAGMAIFTVAVHRRTTTALGVAALNLVGAFLFTVVRPQEQALWQSTLLNLAAIAIITGSGMLVRARRQLIWALRARAERAEAEQRLEAEQARRAERTRIAREMHDVLAHRISLVALHAGGLELRPDLPSDQVRETAVLLRNTAHRALEELRAVIGVLRDDGDDAPAQPQPRLRDIARLVEETRQAGAKIDFDIMVPDGVEPPEPLGRDAYRIVQEALTNVAKHARGTATSVRVSGAPGTGLDIVVRNKLPAGVPARPLPGSGRGLLGLHERVGLTGGTIDSGPVEDEFVVEARLAWP